MRRESETGFFFPPLPLCVSQCVYCVVYVLFFRCYHRCVCVCCVLDKKGLLEKVLQKRLSDFSKRRNSLAAATESDDGEEVVAATESDDGEEVVATESDDGEEVAAATESDDGEAVVAATESNDGVEVVAAATESDDGEEVVAAATETDDYIDGWPVVTGKWAILEFESQGSAKSAVQYLDGRTLRPKSDKVKKKKKMGCLCQYLLW